MKSLIITPTYNEKENITVLLDELTRLYPELHVLVVDDNSPDGTGRLVSEYASKNPHVHLLSREKKEGLGPAYLAGFRWGLERGYELLFEMDADFSHHPRYIADFLKTAESSDVVIGSRWTSGGGVSEWPMTRVALSYFANLYSRLILGVPIRDLTGGFIAYKRHVLASLDFEQIRSDGYSFQIEMKYRIFQKGYTLREIPILFTDRTKGQSKISRRIIFEALLKVWVLRSSRLPSKR